VKFNRRAFLQQSAVMLAGLGLSQIDLGMVGDRTSAVFAQPTRRKLALLVGINQYPDEVSDERLPGWTTALGGCVTDVDLQRELLIHRFGFQPSDVLTLVDQQATREAIEQAFLSHLINQAQSGDVVVFHFSGFGGRRRQLDDPTQEEDCLIPVDGNLPTQENPVLNEISKDTLTLLLRSLKTDQVMSILDVSYVPPERLLQGGLRVRSRPDVPTGVVNPAELDLQDRLRSQLNLTPDQVRKQTAQTLVPGILLAAANPNQLAVEGHWNGFSAGLLTYALTQHLWWAAPSSSLLIDLSYTDQRVKQVVGDQQSFQVLGNKNQTQGLLSYYSPTITPRNEDGVITGIEPDGKTAHIWLGGLPPLVVEHYGVNALLSLEQSSTADGSLSSDPIVLQGRSQQGLILKARLVGTATPSLKIGQRVYEKLRYLPRNVGLTVALDTSLERVERVDATSAFSSFPKISAVIEGEQAADCLFGKIETIDQTLAVLPTEITPSVDTPMSDGDIAPMEHLPVPKMGYGLFYLGRKTIPNTTADEDEAVKTAVTRLIPRLRVLLSTKLLRLTENIGSSQLGVRATLETVTPQERILAQQTTTRAPWPMPDQRLASLFLGTGSIPSIATGTRLQYRLQNYGDRPVYYTLFGLDPTGASVMVYSISASGASTTSDSYGVLQPDQIISLPQTTTPSEWVVQGPPGIVEMHLVFCREPFTQTDQVVKNANRGFNNQGRLAPLVNPLEVAEALLQDLHDASMALRSKTNPPTETPTDSYALDLRAWATMTFLYQIVESV
jgi:hypothetical protein